MYTYVQLYGGLGNQLFQYATGYAIARRHGVPLILDTSGIERPLRTFELPQLRLPYLFAVDRFGTSSASRCAYRAINWIARGTPTFEEPSLRFAPEVLSLKPPIGLSGCFQSPSYFSDFEAELREVIYGANLASIKSNALIGRVFGACSVAVHVRRGDFATTAAKTHGILPENYYRAAMAEMEQKVGICEFFIFSDDDLWAQSSGYFPRTAFYASDPARRDIDDFLLMASCTHNIIANSTFSWWSAWLNPNPEKLVVAPKTWTVNEEHCSPDICPRSWIRI